MTANPTTDQILANLADLNRRAEVFDPMSDANRRDVATFAQRLTDTLPGCSPAVIGQVLLHTADVYGRYATCDGKQPISTEALIAVRVLSQVGMRLYLGDERERP